VKNAANTLRGLRNKTFRERPLTIARLLFSTEFVRGDTQTIWIADAHRYDGQRFVVRADEKLTAFLELERGICIHLLTKEI
jgi:hypothetical protein